MSKQRTKRTPPAMRLTARDIEIVQAIYSYRVLTTPQVQRLFFPGDPEQQRHYHQTHNQIQKPNEGRLNQARRRLKLLYQHGYLWRGEQVVQVTDGSLPYLYFLNKQGAELLEQINDEAINWKPKHRYLKPLFIPHLVDTNDVRISFTLAMRPQCWLSGQDLERIQGEAKEYVTITMGERDQRVAVIPDGYFVVRWENLRYHFFLEVDRATESGTRWGRKIKAYVAYYRSGLYEQRYGTKSLRILTVTTSPERLTNLKRITEKVGGKGRFWFTTFDQLTPETAFTANIWQKGGSNGTFALIPPEK